MTKKIINTCEYYKICESACDGALEDTELCSCYQLYKQLKRLEQENKELENRNVELQITLNEFDRFNNYRSALEKIKAIISQPCNNCKYNKDGVTCSIGDCGEGKLKIIENKINEVLK